MPDIDWYEIKFLESSDNLKGLIKESVGRTPSTKIANEIAVCIQQGRLFFDAALAAPLQIQPLQIFYGVVGFAKAVVLARNIVSIDTLAQSHGLSDISAQNAKIEQLSLKIKQKGTFQQFIGAEAPLGRIWYYDNSMPQWVPKPFDNATKLAKKILPIKEIFSRIPYLQHLYEKTFQEPAKTWHVDLHYSANYDGYMELRIDDPELYTNRETLVKLVQKWRQKIPFLENWCLSRAELAWGNSILIFCNVDKTGVDEFSTEFLVETNGQFVCGNNIMRDSSYTRIHFPDIIKPLSGGITNSPTYVIQPYEGAYLSEYSLQFLGCYLLSSLVRYTPQTWQHAISRSASSEYPADDRCLALVERFLDVVLQDFSKLVVHSIDYLRVP